MSPDEVVLVGCNTLGAPVIPLPYQGYRPMLAARLRGKPAADGKVNYEQNEA
jgi:hypothetical protein